MEERGRANRVAERGELARRTVLQEVVTQTHRRFARLESGGEEPASPASERSGRRLATAASRRGPSPEGEPPSAAECARNCQADWDRTPRRAARLRSLRVIESGARITVGSEVAGVMEGKQTIGSSVIFTVRTFIVRLDVF